MTTTPSPSIPASTANGFSFRDAATELLRNLIICDTSNPPGRETNAAAIIEAYVEGSGLECKRVAKDPERTNLVVRLRGNGTGPSMAFLSHLDVIGVHRDEWSVDPFAAVVKDEHIWGRGAVDMKCQVAASVVALTQLAREGFRPNGDLLLILTSDEEDGDLGVGAPHLVEAMPDLKPDYVAGEGSGERFDTPTGPVYMLDCGVKGSASAKVTVIGRSGDASLMDVGHNAIDDLAVLIDRMRQWESPTKVPRELQPMLDALAPDVADPIEQVAAARSVSPALDQIIGALTRTVFHPVILDAPGPDNVVPRRATALISAIVVPGTTKEDLEAEVRAALGDSDYELEVEEPNGGLISSPDTPLRDAIAAYLAEADPEATLVPGLAYGLSDCQVMRESYGSIAYGFLPFRYADPMLNLTTKHSADERIAIDDLEFQARGAYFVARYMGGLTNPDGSSG
jgi:acetylornithine deacetylase/succinyl-diaminopimelate desuccinylase-like protein